MQLSFTTKHLLAQHLFWINNGYDSVKLYEEIKGLRNQNPFRAIKLNQIEDKIGRTISDDFDLKELEKLTYIYPYLIDFDGDLSFLKYCINLNEANFSNINLVDIGDYKYLKNLTKLDLSNTNINSIDVLTSLVKIEELNLENCKLVSLAPLLHHNKLIKIILDNIEEEDDVLNIISNQEAISAEYYVHNCKELMGLTFPRYLVCVNLEKEALLISMTSIVTDKFSSFLEIPIAMKDDSSFVEAYINLLDAELDKRIKAILKANYEIVESSKYYTNEEIDFGVKLKIKRVKS